MPGVRGPWPQAERSVAPRRPIRLEAGSKSHASAARGPRPRRSPQTQAHARHQRSMPRAGDVVQPNIHHTPPAGSKRSAPMHNSMTAKALYRARAPLTGTATCTRHYRSQFRHAAPRIRPSPQDGGRIRARKLPLSGRKIQRDMQNCRGAGPATPAKQHASREDCARTERASKSRE